MPAADSAERIQALLAFYRETHYDVELADGGVATIRPGTPPPAAIARWIGEDVAAYMTACNPHSQSLPREENERRLDVLRAELRELGARFLEGVAHVPGESWREPSLLVAGIAARERDRLAVVHEQNGILLVRARVPAVMRIYRADWRAHGITAADLDWAE